MYMKKLLVIFVIAALVLFVASSPWEGAAAVAPAGELPADGFYIATNSFPRNTVVDITNIETNRSIRAIVSNTLNSPGLLAVVSREAAELIGMRSGSVSRIRMVQPSDPIAYLRFTESMAMGVPEFDSGDVITEETLLAEVYEDDTYIPPGAEIEPEPELVQAPAEPPARLGYIVDEPEWGGSGRLQIVDLPGYEVIPVDRFEEQPTVSVVYIEQEPQIENEPEAEAEPVIEDPWYYIAEQEPEPEPDWFYETEPEIVWAPEPVQPDPVWTEPVRTEPVHVTNNDIKRDVVKDVPEKLNERDPAAVVKDVPDYLPERYQDGFDKETPLYYGERPRNEVVKDTYDYLTEVPRDEVIKDPSPWQDYVEPVERPVQIVQQPEPPPVQQPVEQPREEPVQQVVEQPREEPREVYEPPVQQTLVPVEAQPNPPETSVYGINPADIIPGIVIATPERPGTSPQPQQQMQPQNFSVRTINHLDRGQYYVQIAALSADKVEPAVRQIDRNYDPVVFRGADNMYRILIGPLNQGESAAILARFKSIGYNDAFVRRGG